MIIQPDNFNQPTVKSATSNKLISFLKWWLVIWGTVGLLLVVTTRVLGGLPENVGMLYVLSTILGLLIQLGKILGGIGLFKLKPWGALSGITAYCLSIVNNLSIIFQGESFGSASSLTWGTLGVLFIALLVLFLSTIDLFFIILNCIVYRKLKKIVFYSFD